MVPCGLKYFLDSDHDGISYRADAYEHDNVMPAAAPRTEDIQRYLYFPEDPHIYK
jgi:hypothetical protein